MQKRFELRTSSKIVQIPITCSISTPAGILELQVVNYHYRGACFGVKKGDRRVLERDCSLNFYLGNKPLKSRIHFRICWETIDGDGLFGVEFLEPVHEIFERASRVLTNPKLPPTVTAKDPTDPNRVIYFSVFDIANQGMQLKTSLSNKFLFPGMSLKNSILQIPGQGSIEFDLFIENIRPDKEGENLSLGVSVSSKKENYLKIVAPYLIHLAPTKDEENLFEKLEENLIFSKNIKEGLTYKIITDEAAYKEILHLRLEGYGRVGKVRAGTTWKDMGEGLDSEGVVIGGYLAGKVVASVELRFSKDISLRLEKHYPVKEIEELKNIEIMEINKLVVHPRLQRTDVVLGMFQRIHASAMYNGKPAGLIMATDALVPSYKKLGSYQIGLTIPHPVVDGVTLNAMLLPKEVYEDLSGLNPLAWKMVYENTHSFMSNIGLSSKKNFNIVQKIEISALKLFRKILEAKKKYSSTHRKNQQSKNVVEQESSHKNFIDPKWTRQHVLASVIHPYVVEGDEMIGSKSIDEILNKLGVTREYIAKQSNWLSMEFYNCFIEEFKKIGDVNKLQRQSAYRSFSKDMIGINYYVLKHLLTPEIAFKTYEKMLPKFNRTRTYKLLDLKNGHCRVLVGTVDKELLPKDPSTCINWSSNFEAYIKLITGKAGAVNETKCCLRGDAACEFEINWKVKSHFLSQALTAAFAISSSFILFAKLRQNYDFKFSISVEILALLSLALAYVSTKFYSWYKKYFELKNEFDDFQKGADEKYLDLQDSKLILDQSYQEARLIEELSKEIQKTDNLDKLLNIALNSVRENFGFSRAFVMLINDKKDTLQTAAVAGLENQQTDIWKFKVDVSVKRESPVVISSVFHTGASILIPNVEEHRFQLNKQSQALIDQLGTTGFCMVAIPSNIKSWGVLIADKHKTANIISRRDIVLLQRVAQNLGLALDKKAQLDMEIQIRKTFEKYVPSVVVSSTLGHAEPVLGGQTREVVCMFIDIRGFTSISSKYPATVVVEFLNRFFTLADSTVRKYNGLIDKYLGDGLLVMWGTTNSSMKLDSSAAVQAAIELTKAIADLNQELTHDGLPQLNIGIGIHRGEAIIGNIGSRERMEHTAIGPTINLASRMEGLSKEYNSSIVISESLFENLDNQSWAFYENVEVRGLEQKFKIAVYLKSPLMKKEMA